MKIIELERGFIAKYLIWAILQTKYEKERYTCIPFDDAKNYRNYT